MKFKTYRKHSLEFKKYAVQHSIESPDTLASIANQLGIHPALLSKWRSNMIKRPSTDGPTIENEGPDKSYQELINENRKLKKALERAELEAEILKKAKEYFGKNLK